MRRLDLDLWEGFKLHSVDELMSIGEFSARSGLSPKRLRSYAAEGLLVPAAVDPSSGYRFYAPEQLPRATVIDALRQAGMPLADIRQLAEHPDPERLNRWEQQLNSQGAQRLEALDRARALLAAESQVAASTPNNVEGGRMTKLRAAGRSETGRVRDNNEDAIVHTDRLAVVADGMGGAPGGEVAAQAATACVHAAFAGGSPGELAAAVRAANWAVWDRARDRSELAGMGTTLCAAGLLDNGRVVLAHVGDSRAYLWRDGTLTPLTQDHTVTAELVRHGELSEEQARTHPHRGVLTRALGVGPDVEIDRSTLAVEEGDRIVVCSDGLFNELSGEEIATAVARGGDVAAIVDNLVESAIAHGGRDNVSVVVAEVAA